jgi:hypothetical protein
MHHYVFADPGGADRSAQPEFSADTRRFTPLPTAAGGVRGEQLVEGNSAFGFEWPFCGLETVTGRALRFGILRALFEMQLAAQSVWNMTRASA